MAVYDIDGNAVSTADVRAYYPNRVKSVAHKKNLKSELMAAYNNGFYYIEVDVNRTSDGYIILEHGQVDYTYASWNNSADKMTFETFIGIVRKLGIHPYIELKQWLTAEDCETIVDLVNDYALTGKVTYLLSGNNNNLITKMFEIAPDERYGYLTYTQTAQITAWKEAGRNVFADIGTTSDSAVEGYKEANIECEVWTINDKNTILSLNPWVTGVTSDNLLYDQVLLESLGV